MHKKAFKALGAFAFIAVFTYGILSNSSEVANAVRQGIFLCVQTVIPSLFPFFILSGIVIDTGLAGYLGKALEKIMLPLFRINGSGASALALGLIGGYPIGASCAAALYEKKLCSKSEAERLLGFCNNSGPGFIIGAVGAGIFGDVRIGILIYAVHAFSSIITGILFRFYKKSEATGSMASTPPSVVYSFPESFAGAVKSAVFSCINISGFVICFSVVICLMNKFDIFAIFISACSTVTNLPADLTTHILSGFLEVTNGLLTLPQCSGGIKLHVIISAALLGWAGVSVHCQTLSIISGSGLSFKPYLIGKLLHAIISVFISAIAFSSNTVKNSLLAFAPVSVAKASSPFLNSGIITAAVGAFFLLGIFLIIIFYELSQNDWKNARK